MLYDSAKNIFIYTEVSTNNNSFNKNCWRAKTLFYTYHWKQPHYKMGRKDISTKSLIQCFKLYKGNIYKML